MVRGIRAETFGSWTPKCGVFRYCHDANFAAALAAMAKLRIFAAILCFAALSKLAGRAQEVEQVLPEAIFPQLAQLLDTSLKQSPRMVNRAIDLEVAENNRIAARSGMLPSVSAYASYYKSEDTQEYLYPNSNNSRSTYRVTKSPFGISLSQPVFSWGERRNTARIGEIQTQIAQGQYREAYRGLAQEIRTIYLRLIVEKRGLTRARFYANYAAAQLREGEERWKQKAISDADIAAIRQASERASLAADKAGFEFESAVAYLARLTGTRSLTSEEIPESIPVLSHQPSAFDRRLASFLSDKTPGTAEAAVLRDQIKIEELNHKVAKTRLKPKLSAVAAYTQDQQANLYGSIDSYSLTSFYAGLSLNWTIFDGFSTGAAVRNSLARRRQLENDYRAVTERLAVESQNQVKRLQFVARGMAISDRMASDSVGGLETVRDERRRGVKSDADVSQAQLVVYDTEIQAFNARIDYLLRVGDFLGTLNADPVVAAVSVK